MQETQADQSAVLWRQRAMYSAHHTTIAALGVAKPRPPHLASSRKTLACSRKASLLRLVLRLQAGDDVTYLHLYLCWLTWAVP